MPYSAEQDDSEHHNGFFYCAYFVYFVYTIQFCFIHACPALEMTTATLRRSVPELPSEADAKLARESGRLLAAFIGRGKAARLKVVVGKSEIVIPVSALKLLVDVLAQMAEGNAVTIMPIHAELTTQQAADFLNVSRPHVVELLENSEIAHRKVGTHRRVLFKDLLAYREKSLARSRKALDELAKQAQELGMGY